MNNRERIDPICGMEGSIAAFDHFFCSQHCLEKYRDQMEQNTPDEQAENGDACTCCGPKPKKWWMEKIFLVIFGLIILQVLQLILSRLGITVLDKLQAAFYDYTRMIWFPILLGILLGGLIDYFVPREYVVKALGRHKKRTIIFAVILGFFMTACSHGILAIAIELYKKGASTAAVVSFLLAAPWANLPITILLFGSFGVKALLFVVCALAIAILTGYIYQYLDKKKWVECAHCDTPGEIEYSIRKDIKRRIKENRLSISIVKTAALGVLEGSWALSKMVLWWIMIGILLASLAQAYIPHHFFMNYMGANLLGLMVTMAFAAVLEICSEGTAPLAFEIYRQTGAFGNAFVFLMAGKRAALWLPLINVPLILLLGYLFNLLLK